MAQTAWDFQEMNQRLDSLDVHGQSTQENQHTFPQSRGMTGVTHHPSDRGGTTSVPSSASYERSEFLGVPVPSYSGSRPRVSSFTSGSNTNTGFIYTSPDDQYRSNEPVPGGGSSQAVVTKEERTSTITPPPIWDDNRLGSYQTTGLVPQAPRARALSGPARARPSTSPRSQSQRTSPPVPTFPPPLNVPHNSDFGATLYDSPSTPHTYHPGSSSFVRAGHQPTLSMPLPNPSENVYQSLAYGGYVSSIPPMAQRTQNVGFESDFQPPSHPRVSESSRPPPNSRTTLAPVAIAPPLKRQTRKPHGSVHACISLNRTDRLRLIKFPPSSVDAVKNAILRSWSRGIQAEKENSGSIEFQMRGNPWGGDGSEAVPAIYMVCEVMSAVYHLGWILTMATDISKRAMDKDTLIYRQGDIPSPCVFMAVSFNDGDKLRLINASNEVINAVKNIWGGNVQRESWTLLNVAWEFKLAGYPWWSSGNESVAVRVLLLNTLDILSSFGWETHTSVDITAGPGGLGKNAGADTDCWILRKPAN